MIFSFLAKLKDLTGPWTCGTIFDFGRRIAGFDKRGSLRSAGLMWSRQTPTPRLPHGEAQGADYCALLRCLRRLAAARAAGIWRSVGSCSTLQVMRIIDAAGDGDAPLPVQRILNAVEFFGSNPLAGIFRTGAAACFARRLLAALPNVGSPWGTAATFIIRAPRRTRVGLDNWTPKYSAKHGEFAA